VFIADEKSGAARRTHLIDALVDETVRVHRLVEKMTIVARLSRELRRSATMFAFCAIRFLSSRKNCVIKLSSLTMNRFPIAVCPSTQKRIRTW